MSKLNRVVCIGELLVDFFTVETDVSLREAELFIKKAGGAPANVCTTVARLGGEARFCGKVGNDGFGHFLEETLIRLNVDTRYLMKSALPTTLAFVTRQQGGERDFVFQRGADGDITTEDFAQFSFDEEVAHFGSATALLNEPFRSAYLEVMRTLRHDGRLISFDPNFRDALWLGREAAYLEAVMDGVRFADFVKMSEQEYMMFLNALSIGGRRVDEVTNAIFAVTLGEAGTKLIVGEHEQIIPSIAVQSVDTTGAGDAFVGAMLYQLAGDLFNDVKQFMMDRRIGTVQVENELLESISEMVTFANIVGALTCKKVGAMDAVPTIEEVKKYSR